MFMRMKKITIALAAALAVLSACEKTPALPVVQFDKTNYILPADEPVTVKVVSDVALTDDVTFTLGGTAVKDVDYTVSPATSVSFADAVAAEIVITPLNNLEDKNIVLELAAKAGSFTVGQNAKATVVITPKEKVYCSFEKSATRLSGTVESTISLKLFGAATGDKFQASGELKIPFTVSGTAVEGTDYEIVGGEKFLVAAAGAKVATVKIKSKHEAVPETIPTLTIALAGSERFIAGVNASTDIVFGGALQFAEIVGKWAYSSYPLHDDPAADKATFDMVINDGYSTSDTWEENIPWKNTTSDVIEFKAEDGVNKLTVSGTGDIFDFLTNAEVIDVKPHSYTYYYYEYTNKDAATLDAAVEVTLSDVNYDFAKTSTKYKVGRIILNLRENGQTLDLIIPAGYLSNESTTEFTKNYDPVNGPYFKTVRGYEDGSVWTMFLGMGYWDLYYVFKKVAE